MQGENEELSIEELTSNLSTYKENLQQVKELLDDEPGNSEYLDLEKELEEAIALTKELLAAAKHNDQGVDVVAQPYVNNMSTRMERPDIGTSEHGSFSVGTKVQAVYSDDGEWYDGTIEAITPNGYYVSYSGWGNKEEVDPANVRPLQSEANPLLEAERQAEATKQAIKRKIAQAGAVSEFQPRALPAKLRIEPNDPEDVKAAKRKKIHAFKSKSRFEKLEVVQNKRQNAWQQFQTTKGKTKKIGFFSGRNKESIFKSPDDPTGKVGVTNSGKGLTDFQKREKYLQLKGANMDSNDD